jgi:hypothetical protein
MPAPPTPLDLANAVARNVVPLAGIVFLGWSAPTVLLLYFVDTLLAMLVIFAGLMRHFLPPGEDGWAARVNAEAGYVGGALLIAAFMAIPLGTPLLILFAASGVTWHEVVADPMFRSGLALQAIAAFWSGRALYRALRTHAPEDLRLKRRFALVFLRWVLAMMATYLGLSFLFGRFASLLIVALYMGATIVIEVAPDAFLRAMPGGDTDPDADPGSAVAPGATDAAATMQVRARERHGRRHKS